MKHKIIIFIIYGLILFGIGMGSSYFLFVKNISDTKLINNIQQKKDSNISGTGITIKEALSKTGDFSRNINSIKEEYNFAELLVDEFKKVKNQEDFKLYQGKFGNQNGMIVFIKLKNKDLFLKYMDFYLSSESFKNNGQLKKDSLFMLNKIIDSYILNGYYDDLGYQEKDGSYDYFRLSLMSLDLQKKLDICKEGFNNKDDYNSCFKYIIYMSASKQNNYCDKLEKDDEKKMCVDTLKLIK